MICLVRRISVFLVLFALASPASAQLERAERAFADVDLEGTRDAARAALDGGGLSRDDVVRAYRLLGLSQAALGENRAAYESFVRMLALDPEASLERSIAPQLRGPYLEARGYWSARSGDRFSIDLVAGPNAFVVRVRDPLGLARTIRTRARLDRDAEYRPDEAPAAPEVAFEIEGYEGYAEVVVVAQDEHGNALATLGTDVVPVELGVRREPSDSPANPVGSSTPEPRRIVGGVTLGLAAASVALGAAFHVRRQSLADDWNGEGCEQAIGATRAEQCGDVRDDLDRAQTLAVVGYALAGILATTGVVLLAIGGSDDEPTRARVDCGITGTGLRCDGRF